MSKPEVVGAVLLAAATLYAVFGGADFGAGVWELFASRTREPESVRTRISHTIAPVWEANHVWLIFILVIFWTGFPEAFSAVMETLYIPLALAALGIVLRGAGFAFGKVIEGTAQRRAQLVFALSSVITPFFMGCVIGAIASGQVPPEGGGDPTGSWIGFLPLTLGALFVSAGAYLAAVFLVHDASAAGEEDNARQFGRWALGAALTSGGLAALGVFALSEDAPVVWDGMKDEALPLAIASVAGGALAFTGILRAVRRGATSLPGLRPVAVAAVAALIWGGGIAQHPYLLPSGGGGAGLTIDQAAAPDASLTALLVVFGAAALIVVPALGLLYTLMQRRLLE